MWKAYSLLYIAKAKIQKRKVNPTPLQNVLLSKCLQPCDSTSNAVIKRSVLYVFINLRCAESVCLYYGLRVCGQK